MKHIWEICDQTEEDCQWSLGLFESLEDANKAIDKYFAAYGHPPMREFGSNDDESVNLIIYKRQMGLQDLSEYQEGPLSVTREFVNEYVEELDEYVWKEVDCESF